MEKTERGFTIYGRVTDGRGNVATVQESSAVGGPYAWVFVRDAEGRDVTFHRPTGSHVPATMHLDAAQARALARLLQAFAGDRDAGEEAWLRGELAGLARVPRARRAGGRRAAHALGAARRRRPARPRAPRGQGAAGHARERGARVPEGGGRAPWCPTCRHCRAHCRCTAGADLRGSR